MIEFKTQKRIRFNNLLHWSGTVYRAEVDNAYLLGVELLQKHNAEIVGPIITCVHTDYMKEIQNQIIELEYYIPISKEITTENEFDFVSELLLYDCLICRYMGEPMGTVSSQNEIEQYMKENGLKKISDGYTVFWGKLPDSQEVKVDLVFETGSIEKIEEDKR